MLIDITPSYLGNIGGFYGVYFVEAEGLEAAPTSAVIAGQPGTQVRLADVGLRSGFAWASCYHTPYSGFYRETTEDSVQGPLIVVQLQLFVPGSHTVNRAALHGLVGRPLVIRTEDLAGDTRLLGHAGQYMRLMRTTFDTQIEMAGRRGTLLEFSGNYTDAPPVVV